MRNALVMLVLLAAPAFAAPPDPMASVPTGIPFGICTIDSSESIPLSDVVGIGTPITGKIVFAATTPARCAAPPAAAITTLSPRDSALLAHSKASCGVRCALMTRFS